MVCMGNICRSPLAQGIAEREVARRGWQSRVEVDSAGTHAYHENELPDPRARKTAGRHGLEIEQQRARRVVESDFEQFDLVLAMDQSNFDGLISMAPQHLHHKIEKIMGYSDLGITDDVPDPYYGGSHGFEQVVQLLENAMQGLMNSLEQRLNNDADSSERIEQGS